MAKDLAPNSTPPAAKPIAPKAQPLAAKPVAARPAAQAAPAPQQQAMAAKAATAQASDDDEEEGEEEESRGLSKKFMFNTVPSVFVSSFVHAVGFIVLSLMIYETETKKTYEIVAKNYEQAEEIMEFQDNLVQQPVDVNVSATSEVSTPTALSSEVVIETDISPAADLDAAAIQVELSDFGSETAPRNDLAKSIGAFSGSGLEGRGAAARKAMVAAGGGNDASEAAVAMALKWFADHQNPDGSWSFDHSKSPRCLGKCNHAGTMESAKSGATGMALLPYLGSGQTHREGAYKENVRAGLYYLVQSMKPNGKGGGSLADGGNMYSHGVCSIVLCEAYAMTHDKELMMPAQMAINHIVYAQDPVGGGWRYSPRQAGDTSAVGWQLMALKSGHMAYLQVPPNTILGAIKFLDSVQADSGSKYGYTSPGAGLATTAVGLLSRMYLGWKKDNPALERGVEFISKTGPNKGNMYYNYYATQIMRHNEGEEWKKWNVAMRDWLVEKQDKTGHQKGSWFMEGGDHGAHSGGRHYCTSMSTMILEVYYRHMPIYKKAASEDDFPL